jgi:Skp family chaperone for outer membrane proteins
MPRLPRRPVILLSLLLLLTLGAAPPLVAQGARAGRLAVIDSRLLLDSVPGRVHAEHRYQDEIERAERLVNAAADSLRLAADQFARAQGRLTPLQREAALLVLRARELAVEDFTAQLSAAIAQRRVELRGPLDERVRAAVAAVRRRGRYAGILDRADFSAFSDVDPALDVTADVLAELRRMPALDPLPTRR